MGAMMDAPTQGETILRPREEKLVYATAQFSEAFYSNEQDVFTAGQVEVSYQRERTTKEVKSEYQAFVYARNAINWSADVHWIGSFINPQDRTARQFAGGIIESNSEYVDVPESMASTRRAMLVFNALNASGLEYVSDPANPYGELKNKTVGIDDVQYAAELLQSRTGDCDDLTVLFCSLLESIGIETAVIDVPGHMFMMFRADLPWSMRKVLKVPDDLLVQYQNWIYIPVEVTKVGTGFMQAWYTGADAYQRWAQLGELNVIDLRQAWRTYPPVPLKLPPVQQVPAPDQVDRLMTIDISEWLTCTGEFMRSYESRIDRLSRVDVELNDSAVVAVRAGDYGRAELLFRRALESEPGNQHIICNLADLLCLDGRFEEAFDLYGRLSDSSFMAQRGLFDIVIGHCLFLEGPMMSKQRLLEQLADSLSAEFGVSVLNPEGFSNLKRCLTVDIEADCHWLSQCVHGVIEGREVESEGRTKEGKQTEDTQTEGDMFLWHQ
jgi:hypothetical protein